MIKFSQFAAAPPQRNDANILFIFDLSLERAHDSDNLVRFPLTRGFDL